MTCETCAAALEPSFHLRGWLTCARCETSVVDPAAAELDLRIHAPDGDTLFTIALPAAFRAQYRLERLLGLGGMGAVFGAVQLSVGRPVALKVLVNVSDRAALMRFHREARMLGALDHPAVVRVYDVGLVGSSPYLAMEWMRGGSLRDRMPEGACLDPARVLELMLPVLAGLEYCHGHAIVHRDLKPENILLGDDGGPRIADFGLAACRDFSTRITAASTFMGTPHYVAPEVATGEDASPASDVYAVGVMMFEALCGRPPFRGSLMEVINQHINQPPPRLLALRPDLPVELDRVMTRCLAKRPGDRYLRASALAHDLARLGQVRPSAPAPEVATAPLPQVQRRARAASPPRPRVAGRALAATALACGVALVAVMTRHAAPASRIVASASVCVTSASGDAAEPVAAPRAGAVGYGSRAWVEPQPVTADISRDGQWMASRSGVRSVVRYWKARTGQVVTELGSDSDPAGAVRFSPAGDWLGVLQMSGKLVAYRVGERPGEPQVIAQALPGSQSTRSAMALEATTDARWLAAVMEEDRVWALGTGLAAKRLAPPVRGGNHTHVEVDAVARHVACVDASATFREWDAESGALVREEQVPGLGAATQWAWHAPTGRLAFPVSGSGDYWQMVHLHRLGTHEPPVLFMPADGSIGSTVGSLRFSADGRWLLAGCVSYAFRDRLEWWNVTGAKPVRQGMHMGNSALDTVSLSSDGRYAIGCYRARKLLVAARTAPEPLEVLSHDVGHEGPVVGMALESTDHGLDLVTAGYDLSVRVWDPVTRRARVPPVTYSLPTAGVRRCPCGNRLIITDLTGGVKAVPFDDHTKFLTSSRVWQVLDVLGGPAPCAHPLLALDRDGVLCRVEPGSAPVPVGPAPLQVRDVGQRGATPARVVRRPGGGAYLVEVALLPSGVYRHPPTALSGRLLLPPDEWLPRSAVWLVAPPARPVPVCAPEDGPLLGLGFGPGAGEVQAVLLPRPAAGLALTPVRLVVRAADGAVLRRERLPALPCPPTAGAVSPDGRLVLVGGMDGELRALTAAGEWRVVASLVARAALVCFDSASETVAVGTWDGSLVTWPVRELAGW